MGATVHGTLTTRSVVDPTTRDSYSDVGSCLPWPTDDVPGLQQRSIYNQWLLIAAFLCWQVASALLRGPTMPRSRIKVQLPMRAQALAE
jgi:hypothetical protein